MLFLRSKKETFCRNSVLIRVYYSMYVVCEKPGFILRGCRSCQINKRRTLKYGKLPTKTVVMTPWEVLCVNLIGPYTLKGKDGSQIDFMCLTMIDPASSWFEIVELPVIETITPIEFNSRGKKVHRNIITKETYFDKTSTMISHLVNKTWLSRYPCCRNIVYDNVVMA